MKTINAAILQVADTGPLESLVVMLEAVGIRCRLPDAALNAHLRGLGCDTVLTVADLVRSWGYDQPMPLPAAGVADMGRSDVLYVDVKAHRNGPLVWRRWPNLERRTLWYRINGGKPEHVVNERGDHGDEVNPPCPVLTPNQWYRGGVTTLKFAIASDRPFCENGAYTCWPPFVRFSDYGPRTDAPPYDPPVCFLHNAQGWGYGRLFDVMRAGFGLRIHGVGSPDGLVNHREVPGMLSSALCMVHLKSSDAPGYALYEALASGCPVVCTRRLIWRCRMEELLIPGETCLVFDRETHEGLTDADVASCTQEVLGHLDALRDPAFNARIGAAGRDKLVELMWREGRDGQGLRDFITRNFS